MAGTPLHRNVSPYGWWIATYVLRAAWDDDPSPSDDSPCLSWENTILVRGADRDEAFEKATAQAIGAQEAGDFHDGARQQRRGRWVFEGLTLLLPVHEELGDGCEILWTERDDESLRSLRSRIKSKKDLPVFDDEEVAREDS